MMWPLRREVKVRPIETRLAVSNKATELRIAKGRLAEVFPGQSGGVDEMISGAAGAETWCLRL